MGNFFARSRSNVKIEHVEIDLTMDEPRQPPPVGANLDERNFSPIHEGPQPNVNMLAAQLAVDKVIRMSEQNDFSNIFLQYHRACVQVICTTKENRKTKGSGILFKISKTRLILVTAAHVIPNNNCLEHVILVIECNYRQLSPEQVRADKVYILKNTFDIYRKEGIDVAVIFLNEMDSAYVLNKVSEFPLPSCASTESASDTFMSIHYAEGRNKQVSVGRAGFMRGDFLQLRLKLHIDGGPGASGAPLFNIEGDVVAILNSRQIFDGTRDFIRIEDVFNDDYLSGRDELHDLHIIEKNEGLESRKLLNDLFQEKVQVNVSRRSMKYLIRSLEISQRLAHKYILRVVVFHCLGVGGAHGVTSRWSLLKNVDSDHFPAVNAYIQASICKKRNVLPAITIPKIIHAKLDTTGSSKRSKDFRSAQARNITLKKTCRAIKANFDDYQKKGLFRQCNYICTPGDFKALLRKYFVGFLNALKVHVELHFIDENEKNSLLRHIKDLIKNGVRYGEKLESEDRIAIIQLT